MTIHVFSRHEFEQVTSWPGFKWARVTATDGQLLYEYDVPFPTGAPGVTLQVYSSIDPSTGWTRKEAGEDSIRFVVKYNDAAWKWPKSFWVNRTPGWADRLKNKFVQHLDMIAPRGDDGKRALRRCDDCGGYQRVTIRHGISNVTIKTVLALKLGRVRMGRSETIVGNDGYRCRHISIHHNHS